MRRATRRTSALAVVAVVGLGLGPRALAKRPPKPPQAEDTRRQAAKRFFDAGTLLYDKGEFLAAAAEFERAYTEDPGTPVLLFNVAQAYDKGGERAKAADAYRRYCAGMPPQSSAIACKRAEVLEQELERARTQVAQPAATQTRPPPLPFVEPTSKSAFMTWLDVEGRPYTLLGVGARKVSLFKVYAMALYAEEEPARTAFPSLAQKAGGADRESLVRGEQAPQWFIAADFGKMAVLRFLRAVKAEDTRKAYREALGSAASDRAPPELRKAVEDLLALFGDVQVGDEVVIHTAADGTIAVSEHGQRRLGPKNIRLAHDLWDIWLGVKPISSDLKKGLLSRIDALGR